MTDHYAHRLAKSLGLAAADIADLRQDLLLELLRRSGYFDPARGAWSTFAEMIVRQAADALATDLARCRKSHGGYLDDVVETADGSKVALSEVLCEADGLGAIWSGVTNGFDDIDRRIDLERFIASLPQDLARLCHLLETESSGDAQRLSGLSASVFYRQLEELGMRLRSVGLEGGTPWEKSAARPVHRK